MARWLMLGLLAAVAAAGVFLQHEKTAVLRTELELAREESHALAALRAEQERLRAAQVAPAELERLRADRAAIQRLRAELEHLHARTEQKAARVGERSRPGEPAVSRGVDLNVEAAPGGGILLDGVPADPAAIRARLMAIARGDQAAAIVLRVPNGVNITEFKAAAEGIVATARELKVRHTLRIESSR